MSDPVNSKERLPFSGYLFLIGTAFFTAVSYAIGKSLDKDLDPETTTFFWFFGAFVFSLIISPLIPSQRREFRNLHSYKKIFIYSSVITSVGAALWIISLWTIGPALTSFLMKAQTLFSLFLGILFLGERLNKGETVGILVTIAGGVIVAYQKENYLIIGTITALTAAFFYSFLAFLVKKIANDLNMLTVATLRTLGVSIVVSIFLILTGTFEMPEFKDAIYMGFGGITGAYVAKACQFHSIKLLDVSRTTAVMPLESLFVVILSYFIFDDLPSAIKLAGGALIITGVVFIVIFRGEKNNLLGK
ncbi:MAG: DMT family transporter [Thermodesulfobacteriota bacterium]